MLLSILVPKQYYARYPSCSQRSDRHTTFKSYHLQSREHRFAFSAALTVHGCKCCHAVALGAMVCIPKGPQWAPEPHLHQGLFLQDLEPLLLPRLAQFWAHLTTLVSLEPCSQNKTIKNGSWKHCRMLGWVMTPAKLSTVQQTGDA